MKKHIIINVSMLMTIILKSIKETMMPDSIEWNTHDFKIKPFLSSLNLF